MPDGRKLNIPDARIVTDADEFAACCAHLTTVERFAFDAEFVSEDGYRAELCLIQVATVEDVWLIDPLSGFETSPFWDLVNDERIETVVHAGMEDLAFSYHETGQLARNVFDIQIAAGLVGSDYPMSLQRLARSMLGARLHKSQTLTDWRKRPLSQQQIVYAADDVAYVLPIHALICGELEKLRRMAWAREEFARFGDVGMYQTESRDRLWRVRGVGSLSRQGLAIARELAIERDAIAQDHNRPARVMLKDYLLVEIAKHGWTSVEDIRSLRGLQLRGRQVERLAEAVQRGLDTPADKRPKPAPIEVDTPEEAALCKLVSAVLHDFCQTERVAYQLLSSNKDVRALVWSHTRKPSSALPRSLQNGWRREAVGLLIDELLSGKRAVRVVNGRDGIRLAVE